MSATVVTLSSNEIVSSTDVVSSTVIMVLSTVMMLTSTVCCHLGIDGVSQGVDDPAEALHAHGHVHDGAGPLDNVSLRAEQGSAVSQELYEYHLQVQGYTVYWLFI